MHQRLFRWFLLCALFAAIAWRADAQTAGKGKFDPKNNAGKILVAKLGSGKQTKTVNGVATDLAVDMEVEQSAIIRTDAAGSAVLLFSNGATTKLGPDSELVIDEFLQDPFDELGTIQVSKLDKEPSPSRTKISLNKGELVGDVKQLRHDQDSSFTVQTPVGAAGIRGTVFRIVFRPQANGQVFFQLTTATGRVDYTQPGQGGQTQGGAPNVTASGTAAVQIPQGQEIEILVNVTTNAAGQTIITPQTPIPTTTTPVPPATLTQVTSVAVEIAGAVQNAVFTSAPQGSGTGGGGNTSGGGSTTGSVSGNSNSSNNSQGGSGGQGNQNQGNQNQGQGTSGNSQGGQGQSGSGGQGQSGSGQGGQGQGNTGGTVTKPIQTQNSSGTVQIPVGQLGKTSSP